jgi:glucan phosphoethanolaminetransferase (alkaline phosphatase superfamily)
MIKKIKHHLLIAFVFFALSFIQQYLFYWLKGLNISFLNFGKYLAYFFLFNFLTFSSGPKLRYLFLSLFLILNFFEMAHLSNFGTQVAPSGIYLLFTQFHEISGTLVSEFEHLLIPFLFSIIPLGIAFLVYRKFQPTYSSKYVSFLFLSYLAYNPLRTFFTGNTWGRQPTIKEIDGMNMYLSISYFLGRILPGKLTTNRLGYENESLKLSILLKKKSSWDNIIVVLGESLSPDHMSLFGYSRDTTPFLNTLKNHQNFHFVRGLSSGVSSDISIAFFFNLTYGLPGSIKLIKADHCLYSLAKNNGFSTHFLSIQDQQSLRYTIPYLCSQSVDVIKSFEDISVSTKNSNEAHDKDLLPQLKNILSKKPSGNFIVLHQRGSHAPWELRFSKQSNIFKDKKLDKRINHYDNSVFEFDSFWKNLHDLLNLYPSKNLVVYLSDHGESLGKNKKFGHGFLATTSFEIPMLFFSYNKNIPEEVKTFPNYMTQFNFSIFLLNQLGHETSFKSHQLPDDYEILGNDIDGFAGKAKIKFDHSKRYLFEIEN